MQPVKRVIPCLDVLHGRVVKGVRFGDLKPVGEPSELAAAYESQGADELALLDVSASLEGRLALLDVVERTRDVLSIPLIVGGGVRRLEDIRALLLAGADRVSINTAAVERPELVREASELFGSQCIVVAIDAKRSAEGAWKVYTHGGRRPTGIDAVEHAKRMCDLGAGELLVTSIDADGTRVGYDIELLKAIVESVDIPVIASGGAGGPEHMLEAIVKGGADAVLAASVFHYGEYTVADVKRFLKERGVRVRL
ncbi:MAG: imidazole glycerol phosphate synthase subunit HisF [Fervidicoccaceae archaeon]